tara:strand:+ start:780 stop:1361 length:582 start_codon:yes stop_codon:yes gene_type:complete
MNEKLRVSLNEQSYEMLQRRKDELAQTGNKITWSHALNDCMKTLNELTEKHSSLVQQHEELMRHFHATPAPLSRLSSRTRETVDEKYKEKKCIKKEIAPPKKRGLHLLPKDFAPPQHIAQEAGIDYQGALECFSDWANSKGKKYKDWTATFRGACKSWLKERYPHLRRTPIQPHGNTEILRNEDMSDTRPPLV